MSIDFILNSKVISVFNQIAGEERTSGCMLKKNRSISFNRLPNHLHSFQRINMAKLPNCIIDFLNVHANLLMSWKSSIWKWTDLGGVKIKRLLNNHRIRLNSNLLTIVNHISLETIILFYSSENKHWSRYRGWDLWIRCACVGLFICRDLISKIKWKEPFRFFVQKHHLITKPNKSICRKRLRNFFKWSSIFLLSNICGQKVLFLLLQVLFHFPIRQRLLTNLDFLSLPTSFLLWFYAGKFDLRSSVKE